MVVMAFRLNLYHSIISTRHGVYWNELRSSDTSNADRDLYFAPRELSAHFYLYPIYL